MTTALPLQAINGSEVMKLKWLWLTIVLPMSVLLASCGGDDVGGENEPQEKSYRYEPMRVLCIGNSYSTDALAYLPAIMPRMMKDRALTVAFFYYGGATLEQHSQHIDDETYNFYSYFESSFYGPWYGNEYISPAEVLSRKWDYIILQQQSNLSTDYGTYQPFLDHIISSINARCASSPEIVWLMTPARPDEPTEGSTQWQDICTSTQRVLAETPITHVIPMGTAVQNARQTRLNALGDYGRLSNDGVHLQDGLPRYLTAFTVAVSLLSWRGTVITQANEHYCVDEADLERIWVPHGTPPTVGLDVDNQMLAQRCALDAIAAPYVTTNPSAER